MKHNLGENFMNQKNTMHIDVFSLNSVMSSTCVRSLCVLQSRADNGRDEAESGAGKREVGD